MTSISVTVLSRQLGRLSVTASKYTDRTPIRSLVNRYVSGTPRSMITSATRGGGLSSISSSSTSPFLVVDGLFSDVYRTNPSRTFATNRKTIDAKNARRLKIQAKKKKNTTTGGGGGLKVDSTSPTDDESSSERQNQPFLQHQEWVKFQQSISVDGFQTGQSLTATVLKKSRGGKQARRKREKELMRLQQQQQQQSQQSVPFDSATPGSPAALAAAAAAAAAASDMGTIMTQSSSSQSATKFPALRYSPEETQELLRQAYEALPERTGKRGNRNLRRQARRWKLVRDIRSKYKADLVAAHERRMEQRHEKRQRVLQAQRDAPVQRMQDLEYQTSVLKRYVKTMYGIDSNTLAQENTATDLRTG